MIDHINDKDEKIINLVFRQTKPYGVVIMPEPIYRYPEGHPCYGCVHVFQTNKPSCSIGCDMNNCSVREIEKRIGKKTQYDKE